MRHTARESLTVLHHTRLRVWSPPSASEETLVSWALPPHLRSGYLEVSTAKRMYQTHLFQHLPNRTQHIHSQPEARELVCLDCNPQPPPTLGSSYFLTCFGYTYQGHFVSLEPHTHGLFTLNMSEVCFRNPCSLLSMSYGWPVSNCEQNQP